MFNGDDTDDAQRGFDTRSDDDRCVTRTIRAGAPYGLGRGYTIIVVNIIIVVVVAAVICYYLLRPGFIDGDDDDGRGQIGNIITVTIVIIAPVRRRRNPLCATRARGRTILYRYYYRLSLLSLLLQYPIVVITTAVLQE